MIPRCLEWDQGSFCDLFNARDAQEIFSIVLPSFRSPDRCIWNYTEHGNYTVRSGYKLAVDSSQTKDLKVLGDWSSLWKLNLPPKVKMFLWCLYRECLPTRARLSFKDEAEIEKLSMVLRSIWKERNEDYWTGSHSTQHYTVYAALSSLCEWTTVRFQHITLRDETGERNMVSRWTRPQIGYLKCNCDAALFKETGKLGIGMVLRANDGQFIACKTLTLISLPPVREAEVFGLLKGIEWIRSLAYNNVIFEIDALNV
ncbi:hypothetical protein PTKIN_Ptkin15bG0027800 [Pterospermum kingtungense]